MSGLKIIRQCEKCSTGTKISLEQDYFICSKCGYKNVYDNVALKPQVEEMLRKVRKARFKDLRNN